MEDSTVNFRNENVKLSIQMVRGRADQTVRICRLASLYTGGKAFLQSSPAHFLSQNDLTR